jgi:hypothetical protein
VTLDAHRWWVARCPVCRRPLAVADDPEPLELTLLAGRAQVSAWPAAMPDLSGLGPVLAGRFDLSSARCLDCKPEPTAAWPALVELEPRDPGLLGRELAHHEKPGLVDERYGALAYGALVLAFAPGIVALIVWLT